MSELAIPTKEVEGIRPSLLLVLLKKKFGEEWFELEDETISLELKLAFTQVLLDKVNVLRIAAIRPEMFYEDALFFLHCCDVFNNKPANFEYFPHPNSLEIAWAISDMGNIVEGQFSDDVKIVVTKTLNHEGYSSAPMPLLNACFPDKLVEGQEAEDRRAKEDAVAQYISHMANSGVSK